MQSILSKTILAFIFLLSLYRGLIGQSIPIHVEERAIYDFLDELSQEKLIEINPFVRPFPADYILEKLQQVKGMEDILSTRQRKELYFYLEEFDFFYQHKLKSADWFPKMETFLDKYHFSLHPPQFRYRDSTFYMDIRPVGSITYYHNAKGGNYHRYSGGSLRMAMGKNLAVYANLRDNRLTEIFSNHQYLSPLPGGNYKGNNLGGGDYSEMRGGIIYSFNYGSLALVKDHVEWGTGYHGSSIFSSRAPSFAQIKFNLHPSDWFSLDYFHGWLVSNVIDSTRSYITENGNIREVMHPKYVAANTFTFRPFKQVYFSVGNSVIYSDMEPHPGYLTPVFFYKSVDHWLNSTDRAGRNVGQNSQMFASLSIRRLKGFHFYGTLFIDEFKSSRITDPETFNPFNGKVGVKSSNAILDGISLCVEYTRTNPITYEHSISTTTFQSNDYYLGHYLGSNADEWYASLGYKPVPQLKIKAEYIFARRGEAHEYIEGNEAVTHPFMEEVKWENQTVNLMAQYEFAYNSFFKLAYSYNHARGEELQRYAPDFYRGQNHTFSVSLSFGY